MVSFLLGLQTLLLELPAAILCALLHVARYNLSKVKRTVKSQTCTNPKRIGCPCKDSLYQFAILLWPDADCRRLIRFSSTSKSGTSGA